VTVATISNWQDEFKVLPPGVLVNGAVFVQIHLLCTVRCLSSTDVATLIKMSRLCMRRHSAANDASAKVLR